MISPAAAYTPSVTPLGIPTHWSQPAVLSMAGNPLGSTGLTDQEFFTAVTRSLQRWKFASQGFVDFDYWQGTDVASFPVTAANDGFSTVFFLSHYPNPSRLTSSILASTQVWYNTNTGEIFEADIILNDRDFYFTKNPQDSTEPVAGKTQFTGSKPNVFIENTLTHEIGHAYGLSHSGVLQSTMLYMEAPDQAFLSCDDQVGIQSIYTPPKTDLNGALRGIVRFNTTPVFGAHVIAISQKRGTILASALTDVSGVYRFPHLEPGDYFLMAEPYYAGTAPLPAYFSPANSTLCPGGQDFLRTFLTLASNSSNLQSVHVASGSDTTAATLAVQCPPTPSASSGPSAQPSPSPKPIPLFDLKSTNSFSWVGAVPPASGENQYLLENVSGVLTIHVLSYSLYSPIISTLSLLDDQGEPVATTYTQTDYKSSDYQLNSGFQIYDGILTTDSLPLGSYTLNLTSQNLSGSLYPAGIKSLDSNPFLILFGTTLSPGELSNTGASLANNARCRATEDFPQYTSPLTSPRRFFPNNTSPSCSNNPSAAGGCAALHTSSQPRKNRPIPLEQRISWFLPWIFAFGGLRFLIFLHRARANIRLNQ